ncbi:MAG: helix-turn-helix domain-containing protein [Burkholderiaceae bacterium]
MVDLKKKRQIKAKKPVASRAPPDVRADRAGKVSREQTLREAIELLYFSYRAFTSGPDQILDKRGLNRIHHRILYFIDRNPDGSVNDLLQVLQITKQALHIPLRQLVSMGLVANNKSSGSDGRVRALRLTAEGKRLEQRLTGTQLLQLESVFSAAQVESEHGWREVMRLLADD